MQITFTQNDFKDFRSFEKAMIRHFGPLTYVGTDSAVVHISYSKELKAMLRPYPEPEQFTFDLKFEKGEFLLK